MKRYNPSTSLKILFLVKGALFKKLLPGMITLTIVSTSLIYLHYQYQLSLVHISSALPGYMGAALGLLLVFRNNTAYEKWWEARKEMGALVNTTRNIAININGFLPANSPEKFRIAHLISSFAYTLKGHLRNNIKLSEISVMLHEDYVAVEKAAHKPNVIANIIMMQIEDLWKRKIISDLQQMILVNQVNAMVDILGKCERIKNTPIPIAYAFLLKFFIILYVTILPLGLLDDMSYWSIPLVLILYYILMSIVITAEEIEDPFGKDINDLPMDEISANIKRNVMELVKHD